MNRFFLPLLFAFIPFVLVSCEKEEDSPTHKTEEPSTPSTPQNPAVDTVASTANSDYFTVAFIGDPEYDMRGFSLENKQIFRFVQKLVALKSKPWLAFTPSKGVSIPYYPSLVVILGDIDQDRETNNEEKFMQVFQPLYTDSIPCVTIYGNHDWEPWHWGEPSGWDWTDFGYSSDGYSSNLRTLATVNRSITESEKLGISDVYRFYSSNYGLNYEGEVMPFTFQFRGIRFYCGQTFWFQQWYKKKSWPSLGSMKPTFYNTDAIIEDLEKHIDQSWNDQPAVWCQHYPLSGNDEWWGKRQGFDDGTDRSVNYNSLAKRYAKTKQLIRKTKNPILFTGHTHSQSTKKWDDASPAFMEYTTDYFHNGGLYIVLMKKGVGVVEVRRVLL